MGGNVNFNAPKDTTAVRTTHVLKETARGSAQGAAAGIVGSIFARNSQLVTGKTGDGFEYSGKVDYSGTVAGTHTEYKNGVVIGEHDVKIPYSGTTEVPEEK